MTKVVSSASTGSNRNMKNTAPATVNSSAVMWGLRSSSRGLGAGGALSSSAASVQRRDATAPYKLFIQQANKISGLRVLVGVK